MAFHDPNYLLRHKNLEVHARRVVSIQQIRSRVSLLSHCHIYHERSACLHYRRINVEGNTPNIVWKGLFARVFASITLLANALVSLSSATELCTTYQSLLWSKHLVELGCHRFDRELSSFWLPAYEIIAFPTSRLRTHGHVSSLLSEF